MRVCEKLSVPAVILVLTLDRWRHGTERLSAGRAGRWWGVTGVKQPGRPRLRSAGLHSEKFLCQSHHVRRYQVTPPSSCLRSAGAVANGRDSLIGLVRCRTLTRDGLSYPRTGHGQELEKRHCEPLAGRARRLSLSSLGALGLRRTRCVALDGPRSRFFVRWLLCCHGC